MNPSCTLLRFIGNASSYWPKLYRRLFAFFKEGNTSLGAFDAWLRADSNQRDDQVWIISEGHLGNLHDVIDVSGNQIRMVCWPEDIVIVPR